MSSCFHYVNWKEKNRKNKKKRNRKMIKAEKCTLSTRKLTDKRHQFDDPVFFFFHLRDPKQNLAHCYFSIQCFHFVFLFFSSLYFELNLLTFATLLLCCSFQLFQSRCDCFVLCTFVFFYCINRGRFSSNNNFYSA